MEPELHPARRLWQHVETIHAVAYFAPEVADALAGIGVRGWWRGYFAARSGPLGPVRPGVVQALFHGFAPALVDKCLPSAWAQATPETAMAARDGAVEAILTDLVADVDDRTLQLARLATSGAGLPGRGLYAAHAARPWPGSSSQLTLWWACTLLREHRGDGHVAALTAAGVDGCEANQLAVLDGVVPAERQQAVRGWTDDEWEAAGERARSRPPGFRAAIEATTDRLALGPLQALGQAQLTELLVGLRPVVDAVAGSGLLPQPNPVGVTFPA